MARKRRPVLNFEDMERFVRRGLRPIFAEWESEWKPVYVRRSEYGRCKIERAGDAPLEFHLGLVPNECRPIVERLLDLLDEQAAQARVATVLARAELAIEQKRAMGRDTQRQRPNDDRKTADARASEINEQAAKLRAREKSLSKSAIAQKLSERGLGGKEAIRKMLK